MRNSNRLWTGLATLTMTLCLTGCISGEQIQDLVDDATALAQQFLQEASTAIDQQVNQFENQNPRGGNAAPPPDAPDQGGVRNQGPAAPVQGGDPVDVQFEPTVNGRWVNNVEEDLGDLTDADLQNAIFVAVYNGTGTDIWVDYAIIPFGADQPMLQEIPVPVDGYAVIYYPCFEAIALLADYRWNEAQQIWEVTSYFTDLGGGEYDFDELYWIGEDFECGEIVGVDIWPDGVDTYAENAYESYEDENEYGDEYRNEDDWDEYDYDYDYEGDA